jgi:hypothetical protein
LDEPLLRGPGSGFFSQSAGYGYVGYYPGWPPIGALAVLALLKEKNIETRCQARAVLKRIGTRKSLGPLKELTTYPSKNLSEAAADACRPIQARVDK